MSDQQVSVDIPDKPSFKPSEVCELLSVPAYVLRTWENEFTDLGTSKSAGSVRTYRRRDVELAVRIKELVFVEHLTLAGVRRRLEQEHLLAAPVEAEEPAGPAAVLAEVARARIVKAKEELRSLLQTLARDARDGSAEGLAGAQAGERHAVLVPNREAGHQVEGGLQLPSRARGERVSFRDAGVATPVLPGLGEHDGSAELTRGSAAAGTHEAHLDPAALDFATIASPPARSASRRSRVKQP